MSNEPKVLVEFSPEEIAWLADRLHEEWGRTMSARLALGIETEENKEKVAKVNAHGKMRAVLQNRLVDKAADQGFGDL